MNVIIEKLLHSRFISFIYKNDILIKKQYGFREGLGTNDAIIDFLHNAYFSLNKNEYFGSILLDLSKAFDCVSHLLLLSKLWCYGFRGVSHSMLSSYLSNRKQFVYINNFKSDELPVSFGVPQGSVLGPILFILYINDFPNCLKKCSAILYADDTTVFYSDKILKSVCDSLSEDMLCIKKWLNLNYLTLNIDKTKFIIFTYKSLPDNLSISLENVVIRRSEKINLLGIEIDYKITFSSHILHINNKVSKLHGLFYRLSDFLPILVLLKIYYCLFYSNITYGIRAWGCASSSVLSKLYISQKKVIKTICGKSIFDRSNESFIQLNVLKLQDVFKVFCLNHMFKIFHTTNDCYDYLLYYMMSYQPTHNYNTRDRPLRLPAVSLERFKQSFIYQGTKLWNDLPNDVKQCRSLFTLKKRKENFN